MSLFKYILVDIYVFVQVYISRYMSLFKYILVDM